MPGSCAGCAGTVNAPSSSVGKASTGRWKAWHWVIGPRACGRTGPSARRQRCCSPPMAGHVRALCAGAGPRAARFVVEQYWPATNQDNGVLVQGGQACHWQLQLRRTGVRDLRRGELLLHADRDQRLPLGQFTVFLERP
ncbi:hypothetical protein WR25_22855 [Diploscapter pachys]|uniref:Type II secretion system protein GspI C-terminal domain-containing protein n=1 Tax=Diploscapter pachys TaxID=2018661 RepID=A0A2A2K3K3_9BILA|nr:hypothetical protein WR25_22855 [Diploscapter pachys]